MRSITVVCTEEFLKGESPAELVRKSNKLHSQWLQIFELKWMKWFESAKRFVMCDFHLQWSSTVRRNLNRNNKVKVERWTSMLVWRTSIRVWRMASILWHSSWSCWTSACLSSNWEQTEEESQYERHGLSSMHIWFNVPQHENTDRINQAFVKVSFVRLIRAAANTWTFLKLLE